MSGVMLLMMCMLMVVFGSLVMVVVCGEIYLTRMSLPSKPMD
jgi:hypothetical protein